MNSNDSKPFDSNESGAKAPDSQEKPDSQKNQSFTENAKKPQDSQFAHDSQQFQNDKKSYKNSDSQSSQNENQKLYQKFIEWSEKYINETKSGNNEKWNGIKKNFSKGLNHLGVDEEQIKSSIGTNKKEIFENILGESVSVFAMVFAWKKSDKEKFSQALGELGFASLFALNPLTGIVTAVGLALGYNRLFHPNAFKKGGLVTLSGLGAAVLVPGGIVVSVLAAIIAAVIVNKNINLNDPVESQVRTYFGQLMKGEFKSFTQKKWKQLEASIWNIKDSVLDQILGPDLKK